ncbi:peptidylprolyl isomerase [Platysternon megacephalum]|uniref:Serine/threonine-protein phosphatase 2A activator n=1 Tax=Platysternon megacephalum TaxID=55544 RepID=A0A4D9DHM3_9SAUR|nr:peptidylprolyl isomerase [Platysternon megacephalum]
MFLECILFITEMKTGPFAEHSNQLWNISAVPSWSKVNQGLVRMYKAEVSEGEGEMSVVSPDPACNSCLASHSNILD